MEKYGEINLFNIICTYMLRETVLIYSHGDVGESLKLELENNSVSYTSLRVCALAQCSCKRGEA